MDLNKIKKIHIVGIEGAGTHALALVLKALGKEVTGSDIGDHFYYKVLQDSGIKVSHGFDLKNIAVDIDLVVYSLAFKLDENVELIEAQAKKLKLMSYGEALSLVFNHKYGIAVAGTHGKTTTSAWLAFVTRQAGLSPSAIIGSIVPQFGSGSLIGDSNYFVLEVDEYGNKLQYYTPKMILLNNIDFDHPDYFKSQEDYNQVFIDFISKLPAKGILVANFDDENIAKFARFNTKAKIISYGLNNLEADYVAYDGVFKNGKQYFKVKFKDEDDDYQELGDFCVSLAGKHNISNALAVIIATIELNIELKDIRTYLEDFTGTARRMEMMGKYNGASIINDYAHHPVEIQATLSAARDMFPKNKLIAIFQPHTFSRTEVLLNDFAVSFDLADEVVILDIHGSAREKEGKVHSRDLVNLIDDPSAPLRQARGRSGRADHRKVKYIATLDECEEYLRKNLKAGDVALLLGAGYIYSIGHKLIN